MRLRHVSYIKYTKGHKDSKGEDAPWCIYQHDTDKLLSSHKTESEAKSHLKDIYSHRGGNFVGVGTLDELCHTAQISSKYRYNDWSFFIDLLAEEYKTPDEKIFEIFKDRENRDSSAKLDPVVYATFLCKLFIDVDYTEDEDALRDDVTGQIYTSDSEREYTAAEDMIIWLLKKVTPFGMEGFNESLRNKIEEILPEYVNDFSFFYATGVHPIDKIEHDDIECRWTETGENEWFITGLTIRENFEIIIGLLSVDLDNVYWLDKLI